ncbi:MAG: MFS transporter [Deltaproteobacteria bacterium]|nr:MAG: MFS transporter [Deltaproteobacteria bacterium]
MTAPDEPPHGRIASPYAILTVLALVNFFNYVDRQVLSGLVVFVQRPAASGGLGLTDGQAGLLQSAFMVVHSVASIPLGIAADRFVRRKMIAVGVALWSAATALAGFARTFGQLFASRAAVGIGEATYAPAATALISESFSTGARARALGVFQAGMVLGGGFGIVLGSVVGTYWGWRAAFFVVGAPGFALAAASLAIRERPRSRAADRGPRRPFSTELRLVFGARGVAFVYAAGILITFMVGALQYWGHPFIIRYHYGGDASMSARVGATFGPVVIGAAIAGVVGGSVLADRLERRMPGRGRLLVVGLGPLLGAPFVALGLWTNSLVLLYVSLGLGTALNSAYAGPVLAALHDVVGARAHATATGAYFFLVHFLGDAFSPAVVGAIADRVGSLRVGLSVAGAVAVLGGVAALAGIRARADADKISGGTREG